ncbi:MAG: hypothetical protein ABR509_01470 [Candidatus Limnocylindria bacterium]
MTRDLWPLLPTLAVLLTSCAGAGGGSGGPDPSGEAIEHPSGEAIVVRVDVGGGFVPIEFTLAALPPFTLLGDGRVIIQGPQTAIYPGPALPNLQQRRLSESGIQAVLRLISDTGLFHANAEYTGASNFVADASTTAFTVSAGGRTVVVSIYGLGTLFEGGPELPAGEKAAHERLQQLNDRLNALETWLPDDAWTDAEFTTYTPEALRLFVRNADADAPDPSGIEPEERDWPLDAPLADFGEQTQRIPDFRCGIVAGADAVELLEELANSNQLTRWRSGESVYALIARPLLPDEPATCG